MGVEKRAERFYHNLHHAWNDNTQYYYIFISITTLFCYYYYCRRRTFNFQFKLAVLNRHQRKRHNSFYPVTATFSPNIPIQTNNIIFDIKDYIYTRVLYTYNRYRKSKDSKSRKQMRSKIISSPNCFPTSPIIVHSCENCFLPNSFLAVYPHSVVHTLKYDYEYFVHPFLYNDIWQDWWKMKLFSSLSQNRCFQQVTRVFQYIGSKMSMGNKKVVGCCWNIMITRSILLGGVVVLVNIQFKCWKAFVDKHEDVEDEKEDNTNAIVYTIVNTKIGWKYYMHLHTVLHTYINPIYSLLIVWCGNWV